MIEPFKYMCNMQVWTGDFFQPGKYESKRPLNGKYNYYYPPKTEFFVFYTYNKVFLNLKFQHLFSLSSKLIKYLTTIIVLD